MMWFIQKNRLVEILLTKFAFFMANRRERWLKNYLIADFVNKYPVNMSEALEENPLAYASFNAFFTRALKPELRPLAKHGMLSPADGALHAMGNIEGSRLVAKGHAFTVETLLGKTDHSFQHGSFCTIYLAPKDYHCVHLPADGKLLQMRYIPGRLYSVNPVVEAKIPSLFAENERLVMDFMGTRGAFSVVMVGATVVGSISTPWAGIVNRGHGKTLRTFDYNHAPLSFHKGEMIGSFLLGSTVIMLSERKLEWHADWQLESTIKMGQALEA